MGLTAKIRNDPPYLRVSWFSAWSKPQHFLCSGRHEAKDLITEGRSKQYGIVVTMASEKEPSTWCGGLDNRTPERL